MTGDGPDLFPKTELWRSKRAKCVDARASNAGRVNGDGSPLASRTSTAYSSLIPETLSTRNRNAFRMAYRAVTRPSPIATVATMVTAASGARLKERSANRTSRMVLSKNAIPRSSRHSLGNDARRSEARPRPGERLLCRDALIDQLPGFALDVERELLVQIPFGPSGGKEGVKSKLQVAKAPGRHGVGRRHYREIGVGCQRQGRELHAPEVRAGRAASAPSRSSRACPTPANRETPISRTCHPSVLRTSACCPDRPPLRW
jgi:hypothetical protein